MKHFLTWFSSNRFNEDIGKQRSIDQTKLWFSVLISPQNWYVIHLFKNFWEHLFCIKSFVVFSNTSKALRVLYLKFLVNLIFESFSLPFFWYSIICLMIFSLFSWYCFFSVLSSHSVDFFDRFLLVSDFHAYNIWVVQYFLSIFWVVFFLSSLFLPKKCYLRDLHCGCNHPRYIYLN